jgi:hypothetical protein
MLHFINHLYSVNLNKWDVLASVGKRLPTLKALLENPYTPWQSVIVRDWYGHGEYTLQIASHTAVWYHTGLPALPIRWVLVKDPKGKFESQALLCTNLSAQPIQILQWFRQRWQVEVTFEEVRSHLAVETQRQWSEKAILRTTPALFIGFILDCGDTSSSGANST